MKFLALALLPLAACSSLAMEPPILTGQWGGQHVGLVLDGAIGTLEYDCASGTIDQAIVPAKDGRFVARGQHWTGQGGPVRVGQIFRSQRATYSGQVVKDRMTLNVTLEDGTAIGPFTLVRGAQPQIVRCL
jgi:hypothetical protein